VSHHIIFIAACAPAARTQARRRWRNSSTARSITEWLRTPTGCYYVIARHYSQEDMCIIGKEEKERTIYKNTINVTEIKYFQWFCGLNDLLSQMRMRYSIWIHCYKWPNYSVRLLHFTRWCSDSIMVKWAKLNSFVSSFFALLLIKNYWNRTVFHGTIQKKWHVFVAHGVHIDWLIDPVKL